MLAVAYYLQTLKDRLSAADNERGATAVEYGLVIGVISLTLVAAGVAVQNGLANLFGDIGTFLTNVIP